MLAAAPHFPLPRTRIVARTCALACAALLASLAQAAPAHASWQPAGLIPDSADVAPTAFGNSTQTVVDANGTAIAVWDSGSFGVGRVNVASRPAGEGWSAPAELVADPGGGPVPGHLPNVATAPDGTTTVVWAEQNFAGGSGVWASTRSTDGSWGAPVNVSAGATTPGAGGAGPKIVIDAAGNTTVLWQVGLSLFAATKPVGEAWGAPLEVWAGVAGEDNALSGLGAAVDARGAVTVVWRAGLNNENVVYAKRRVAPGSAWGPLEQITVPPDYYYYFEVAASAAGTSGGRAVGEVTAAFTNGESGAAGRVFVATRAGDGPGATGTGTWSVEEFTGAAWGSPPDIAYDASGRALVAFVDQGAEPDEVVLARREAGAWAAEPETVALADPGTEAMTDADIVADPEGNLTVTWVRSGGEGSVVQVARRAAGGSWGTPQSLSSDSEEATRSSLAVDPIGNVVASWAEGESGVATATFGHTPAVRTDWTANGLAASFDLRSWINYLGGNAGVELAAGASRIADVDPYSFRFLVADAWVQQETGETVVANGGSLRYLYPGHYIDTRIVDPEIRIAADGRSGVLIADGQGSGDMAEAIETGEAVAIPYVDRRLLSLDLAGVARHVSVDGATQTWSRVPATIHPDGAEILAYEAGSAYGFLTITVPTSLPVREAEDTPPVEEPTDGAGMSAGGGAPAAAPPAAAPVKASKPVLKRFGRKLKPNRKGLARLARVKCPPLGGPCRLKAPKRVRVKIAGERFWVKVLAPRRLAAGRAAVVRVKLGRAARRALAGGRFATKVRITVANSAGTVR